MLLALGEKKSWFKIGIGEGMACWRNWDCVLVSLVLWHVVIMHYTNEILETDRMV